MNRWTKQNTTFLEDIRNGIKMIRENKFSRYHAASKEFERNIEKLYTKIELGDKSIS